MAMSPARQRSDVSRPLAVLAERYRRRQVLLAAQLVRDLVRLFRALFSTSQPDESWPEVRGAIALLIRQQRAASAILAARYYVEARNLARPQPSTAARLPPVLEPRPAEPMPPRPAEPPVPRPRTEPPPDGDREREEMAPLPQIFQPRDLPDEQLVRSLNSAGIASYQKAMNSGATPAQARDRAAVALSGAAQRHVLGGGREVIRETVQDDEEAIGWARITDGDPCSWCAMLASRGAVYKTAGTAGAAQNARFVGDGAFKWHDHCGCQVIPVFDPDDPNLARAEELYDLWLEVTAGKSGKGALNAWRRYWEHRQEPEAE